MFLLHIFLLCVAFISLITGLSFLLFPRLFLACSDFFNNIFELDATAIKYRMGLGISLFFIGIFLFFMAYYYYIFGIVKKDKTITLKSVQEKLIK